MAAQLERPFEGIAWKPAENPRGLIPSGLPAWQSNGGPTRAHPARSLPFSFEVRLPERAGHLLRVHLTGVFAMYCDKLSEALGTVGASIQLHSADHDIISRYDLVNGRHYSDAANLELTSRVAGDGSSVETVGACLIAGEPVRVDVLTLDVTQHARPRRIYFKDLGSPASFLVFDVHFEFAGAIDSGGQTDCSATLSGLSSAIRLGDRLKFSRAVEALDQHIDDAEDLDEARGCALTFFGVVCAAMLETSHPRPADLLLLETARMLDRQITRTQIRETIHEQIVDATDGLFAPSENPSDRLVDRALAIVERHFAKDITDAMVAAQLGLSTSHFRFLFRQATGHPFHKYVVALRLEKARQMLIEQEIPISQVAAAVGFTGLSHFSRAFTQRFSASPSHFRRAAG